MQRAPSSDRPLACDASEWLVSEASGRRYARLTRLHRYDLATAVVMLFPKGTPPAEVARVERCTRLLSDAGIPVPRIHDSDHRRAWILQEDLGDRPLARAVEDGDAVDDVYGDALEILARVQALAVLDTSPAPPLDGVRMARELAHFVRTALDLDGTPGAGLAADLERLVRLCADAPTALCHRDYHARNLLLQGRRVRVIDHQDALVGPAVYDRVSLAYDPYVVLDDGVRDALAGNGRDVAPVAVQRLVKAIGTYAGKGDAWRRWIAPAARQARRLIARDALPLPVLDASLAGLALVRP
ncbi:MAG: phosphotransferase [Planctomycetota bacterium]|jgi:aminoglycoside/choline kinase family phosphotransferase